VRRYGLILLVVLIASAGLLAAAAYNTATVVSAASMNVVNTNEALLALSAFSTTQLGLKDVPVTIEDGELVFRFDMGKGVHETGWRPKQWGFQPNSNYSWTKMFKVTNHSQDNIEYTIEVEGIPHISVATTDIAGAGVYLEFVKDGDNLHKAAGAAAGDTAVIGVSFNVPEAASLDDFTGTLVVKARAVETAWRHGLKDW
jgi:hypothetical protein